MFYLYLDDCRYSCSFLDKLAISSTVMGLRLYTISLGVVVSLSCFYCICNSVLRMECMVLEN
jgi:hypothetical protein